MQRSYAAGRIDYTTDYQSACKMQTQFLLVQVHLNNLTDLLTYRISQRFQGKLLNL